MVPRKDLEGEQEQTEARLLAPAVAQHGKEPEEPSGSPREQGAGLPAMPGSVTVPAISTAGSG